MPSIEVPLRDVSEVRGLRKNKEWLGKASQLVEKVSQSKEIEIEIRDLKEEIIDPMAEALTSAGLGEVSVKITDEDDQDWRLSRVAAEHGRKTLNKDKLLKYITKLGGTVAGLEKCYDEGAVPAPYIQVSKIETQDARTVRKFTEEVLKGSGKKVKK